MKSPLTLLILFSINLAYSQGNLPGRYQNYFGGKLKLSSDSTFVYNWRFDLMSCWIKGIWKTNKDTIYLKPIPIFDTLRYRNPENETIDSLVLSIDEYSKSITNQEFEVYKSYTGGLQDDRYLPDKLYFKKERLYEIDMSGRLIKKHRGFITRKKFPPYYFKKDD